MRGSGYTLAAVRFILFKQKFTQFMQIILTPSIYILYIDIVITSLRF